MVFGRFCWRTAQRGKAGAVGPGSWGKKRCVRTRERRIWCALGMRVVVAFPGDAEYGGFYLCVVHLVRVLKDFRCTNFLLGQWDAAGLSIGGCTTYTVSAVTPHR